MMKFVQGRAQRELGTCRRGAALLLRNFDLANYRGGPNQQRAVIPLMLAPESLHVVSETTVDPIAMVIEPIPTDLLVAHLRMCRVSAAVRRRRL